MVIKERVLDKRMAWGEKIPLKWTAHKASQSLLKCSPPSVGWSSQAAIGLTLFCCTEQQLAPHQPGQHFAYIQRVPHVHRHPLLLPSSKLVRGSSASSARLCCMRQRGQASFSPRTGEQLLYQIPNNSILTSKTGLLSCLREQERVMKKINRSSNPK